MPDPDGAGRIYETIAAYRRKPGTNKPSPRWRNRGSVRDRADLYSSLLQTMVKCTDGEEFDIPSDV